jgi:hypothetical protein
MAPGKFSAGKVQTPLLKIEQHSLVIFLSAFKSVSPMNEVLFPEKLKM